MAAQSAAEQVEAEAYEAQPDEADIEELVEWLEEVWQENEEVRESISEQEWEEFIEAVKSELE